MFPVWEWTDTPELRFMFASYASQLATEHSVNRRRILESDWYKSNWPEVKLTTDQNVKTAYENSARGKMIATSVGASATGMGGNRLIGDDVLNPEEADSDVKRTASIDFMDKTLSTRLNDKKRDVIIYVMQRLHESDPTGHILAKDLDHEWVHLCIPEEARERTIVRFPRSGRDIVREVGDILWPEREGPAELASVKTALGTTNYEAQYQQNPTPPGGAVFKQHWWRFYKELPRMDEMIQSWDLTYDDTKDSDFVVGQVWGRVGSEKYLIDQVRTQADMPSTIRLIRLLSAKWPQTNAKLIEKKANGAAAIKMLRKEIPGLLPINPRSSKLVRAKSVTPTIEAGNVFLPALNVETELVEPWVAEFIDEHSKFRGDDKGHDDQVDACTQALARLNKPILTATTRSG
jgi:predicted phage terminase large subunit-like protein